MRTEIRPADDPESFEIARAMLAAGDLVAVPTETVYGLAADATNGVAVARIFAAKGRPRFNPLICHVGDLAMARAIAVVDPLAEALAAAFWPGPLTIVLPLREGSPIHPLATAGLGTVAVRMPVGVAGRLAGALGRPLAAPSANPSGRVSPTSAAHVQRGLDGRVGLILDGGAAPVGVESTIVRPDGDRLTLLRAGAIDRTALGRATGLPVVVPQEGAAISAPGQLKSHYAPHGRVRLNAESVEPGEHFIAFGPNSVPGAAHAVRILNLSPTGDLAEAAANLFAALAGFDDPGIAAIAVAQIPRHGLGEAINDRLARAAAPRVRT